MLKGQVSVLTAAQLIDALLPHAEQSGQEKGILRLLHRLVNIARARSDLARARSLGEEGFRRARSGGDRMRNPTSCRR